MKTLFFAILMTAAIASCKTKQAEKTVVGNDTASNSIKPDSENIKIDSHYFWTAELDAKGKLEMKKDRPADADSLTPAIIINMLNEIYPEVQLKFTRIVNDSIFVNIPRSSYMTQQMGSSGAEAYLAEVTYNLSELNNIIYVDIRFKEGDHASPGTYSRTDFVRTKN